ncbi:uncharacterized protein LOC112089797 [Eutrema salsugineum]|uniref:uncharacterized protein LOC112089797 n=1 Tax=Eutrema salsugineum TaxID=72664 RepID=UPI000CECE437|nr:uncharacterized protein LOC112089797 [Eutrema salsugineum]
MTFIWVESHFGGKHCSEGFTLKKILVLVTGYLGYEDNMRMCSWYPPDMPDMKGDLEDDVMLTRVVHYGVETGALTLYLVREDDPYIRRRVGVVNPSLSEDKGEGYLKVKILEDGDSDAEDNAGENAYEVQYSSSDSEGNGKSKIDDTKYRRFELGQEYRIIESLKKAVTKYAAKQKKDIKYHKSDSRRLTAVCCDRKCPWRLYASINSSSNRVVVRTFQEEHNCTWQEFRLNPEYSANQLQLKILARNINVTWTICERSRLRCLQTFDNDQAEQFARLFDYVAELKEQILALRDLNDQMFPIAWGIVDAENTPNWKWFLEHLVDDLGVGLGNGLTLESDQQKELIGAVKVLLPYAEHRECARHVHAN